MAEPIDAKNQRDAPLRDPPANPGESGTLSDLQGCHLEQETDGEGIVKTFLAFPSGHRLRFIPGGLHECRDPRVRALQEGLDHRDAFA